MKPMAEIKPPYNFKDLKKINSPNDFEELAMQAFRFQYENNQTYKLFCDYMHAKPDNVLRIPFLPIELFKTHKIISGEGGENKIFRSSGTTGKNQSCHFLLDENIYKESLLEGFKIAFGDPAQYSFLALLPGYLERPDSSLIYMVNELMKKSLMKHNHFFKLADIDLKNAIMYNQQNEIKTILFGVSFSLLDFAENNPVSLDGITLIETGGMKGHGEEITRKELHNILKNKFKLKKVCSEYGMTELLSQAYCTRAEQFDLPPWMQVLIREPNDPGNFLEENKVGGINVIDLANINSCCFISTSDLGKKISPNSFEVLGRFDNADLRGCNLLYL
jgi:phenylacetate-coenzyme A ligase PaaK-like adenylate-forming protein